MTTNNDYYTYAYLREDRTPYYIGKGQGNRAYDKRRAIKPPKDKSRIIFLKKKLTEAEAFKHEVYMISVLGRKDLGTGILRNRTNGGEGPSGAVRSAETKKKISETKTGRNSGEKHSQFGRTGALCFNSKAILAIKPDGTEFHFGSGREAARELGVNWGNLCSRYLKTGKSSTRGKFKGWIFIYQNE